MIVRIMFLLILSLALTGCGSSKKGPGGLIRPPTTPPPEGPQPPTVPGFGNRGKLSLQVEQGGIVSTNPSLGPACAGPSICDYTQVQRGAVVTLTAAPEAGFKFEEWERCPGPSGLQCVVTIDALTWVKAEFDRL